VEYKSILPGSKEEHAFVSYIAAETERLANDLAMGNYDKNDVEHRFNAYHENLTARYSELSTIRKRNPQSKSWWNAQCQEAAELHRTDSSVATWRNLKRVTRQAK
jgi:hypothetical protein